MSKGKVKFYNAEKGFGFIKQDIKDEDLFVHISGVNGDTLLKEGDEVEFEVEEGKKGLCAVNVNVVHSKKEKPNSHIPELWILNNTSGEEIRLAEDSEIEKYGSNSFEILVNDEKTLCCIGPKLSDF